MVGDDGLLGAYGFHFLGVVAEVADSGFLLGGEGSVDGEGGGAGVVRGGWSGGVVGGGEGGKGGHYGEGEELGNGG